MSETVYARGTMIIFLCLKYYPMAQPCDHRALCNIVLWLAVRLGWGWGDFDIKTSYQCSLHYYKEKTVARPPNLYNKIPHTWEDGLYIETRPVLYRVCNWYIKQTVWVVEHLLCREVTVFPVTYFKFRIWNIANLVSKSSQNKLKSHLKRWKW